MCFEMCFEIIVVHSDFVKINLQNCKKKRKKKGRRKDGKHIK